MEKIAIYPGSFDPVTNGHIDIIRRASKLFDKIYVVVSTNFEKNPLFTSAERVELLKECVKSFDNIIVDVFSGFIYE